MEYKKPYLRSSESSIAKGACSLGSAAAEGGGGGGAPFESLCALGAMPEAIGGDICNAGGGDTRDWHDHNCLSGGDVQMFGCAAGSDDDSPGNGCSVGTGPA